MYSKVQTTGNSQPGGDSGGLFIIANAAMPPLEIKPAIPPTISGTATLISSVFHLIFNVSPPASIFS